MQNVFIWYWPCAVLQKRHKLIVYFILDFTKGRISNIVQAFDMKHDPRNVAVRVFNDDRQTFE